MLLQLIPLEELHFIALGTLHREEKCSSVENEKKDERTCLGTQHDTKARPTDGVRPNPVVSSVLVYSPAARLFSFSPPRPLCLSLLRSTATMPEVALTRLRRTPPVRACPHLMRLLLVCKVRSPAIAGPLTADQPTAALRQVMGRAHMLPHRTGFRQLPSHRERHHA